jgi:hypothetical protein
MSLVLGFAPFILFAILMRLSVDLALWISLAVAFTIGIRAFLHTRVLKTLDVASVAIFGILALYKGFFAPALPGPAVRLIVDASLFAVALASLVAQQPFTLQYAREEVDHVFWDDPVFVRANYVIAIVWALAFLVMAIADGAATFDPSIPLTGAVAAGLAALIGALAFTWRYPAYVQRRILAAHDK